MITKQVQKTIFTLIAMVSFILMFSVTTAFGRNSCEETQWDYCLGECDIDSPAEDYTCFNDCYILGGCETLCNEACYMQCEDNRMQCESVCFDQEIICIDECVGDPVCEEGCATDSVTCGDTCDNTNQSCMLDCDLNPPTDCPDADEDGILDADDNCLYKSNPGQEDGDTDGIGDACDNCVADSNADQANSDNDWEGDVCDNCPAEWNLQHDIDADGTGDVCDDDMDGDTVANTGDNCRFQANTGQEDADGDGVGDVCDKTDLHFTGYTPVQNPQWVETPAFGMNDFGDVVGWYKKRTQSEHRAYLYSNSAFESINYPSDATIQPNAAVRYIRAWDINNNKRIVGDFMLKDGTHHGYLRCCYEPELGLYEYTMIDVPATWPDGNVNNPWTTPFAINNNGVIVGRYDHFGVEHGFHRAANGTYTKIDFPGKARTMPGGINDNGLVVGYCKDSTDYQITDDTHGFLYDGADFTQIDVPGARRTYVYRINNTDEIVGYYIDTDEISHGFILRSGVFTTFHLVDTRDTRSHGFNNPGNIAGYHTNNGWNGFVIDPIPWDQDGDGLFNGIEASSCTSPTDADTDDDGLSDGTEDANANGVVDAGETDPCNADTDGDGIQDGTETGVTEGVADPDGAGPLSGTDTGVFQPDADPASTTDPLNPDSDGDGILDGDEDLNLDGGVDAGETDPNKKPDGIFFPIKSKNGNTVIIYLE